MSKLKRRFYSPEQKVSILKENLLESVPVSDICDKYDINPGLFYKWQKQFFENGSKAFETNKKLSRELKLEKEVKELKLKLTRKNEVLSELMESHICLKKSLGEI